MKKVSNYLLFVLLIPTCFGCKKDKDKPSKDIVGYWELAEASGNTPPVQYAAGNGNLLVIKDNTYAYYGNGQIVKSGVYTTIEDNSVEQNVCLIIPDDQFTRRIVFDTAYSAQKNFYQLDGDNLSIIAGCYAVDGGHKTVYRRIEPNGPFPVE